MLIQLTAIILLAAIAIGSFFIYNKMNRTYYVEYTEKGSIEYMVKYGENEFLGIGKITDKNLKIKAFIR